MFERLKMIMGKVVRLVNLDGEPVVVNKSPASGSFTGGGRFDVLANGCETRHLVLFRDGRNMTATTLLVLVTAER